MCTNFFLGTGNGCDLDNDNDVPEIVCHNKSVKFVVKQVKFQEKKIEWFRERAIFQAGNKTVFSINVFSNNFFLRFAFIRKRISPPSTWSTEISIDASVEFLNSLNPLRFYSHTNFPQKSRDSKFDVHIVPMDNRPFVRR